MYKLHTYNKPVNFSCILLRIYKVNMTKNGPKLPGLGLLLIRSQIHVRIETSEGLLTSQCLFIAIS